MEKTKIPSLVKKREKSMKYLSKPQRLSDEHKVMVCSLLAEFKPAAEVAARLKDRFNISVTPSSLYYYQNHQDWKPMIERLREQYSKVLTQIPIYHKRVRLERLESQYQESLQEEAKTLRVRREKRKELRSIIQEARAESQPAAGNETNVLAIQFNSLDDQSLLRKKEELLTKINRIGGRNGPDSAQENSSGGNGQGAGKIRSEGKLTIDAQWEAEQISRERVAGSEGT